MAGCDGNCIDNLFLHPAQGIGGIHGKTHAGIMTRIITSGGYWQVVTIRVIVFFWLLLSYCEIVSPTWKVSVHDPWPPPTERWASLSSASRTANVKTCRSAVAKMSDLPKAGQPSPSRVRMSEPNVLFFVSQWLGWFGKPRHYRAILIPLLDVLYSRECHPPYLSGPLKNRFFSSCWCWWVLFCNLHGFEAGAVCRGMGCGFW